MTRSRPHAWRRIILISALVVAAARCAGAQAEPPVSEEHWYTVLLQDQKCGHMHTTIQTVGDEVLTTSIMAMEIRRGSTTLKITVDQRQRETADGKPLAFSQTLKLGEEPVTIEGVIRDGRLKLVQDQYGVKRADAYDFDPEIKFAWGLYLEQQERGLKPGTSFKVKTYDPSIKTDGPFEINFEVLGKEPFTMPGGGKRTLTKVSTTMQLQVPVTSVSWLEDDATPVVMDFNMGGFALRVIQSSKEEALAAGTAPELFLNTFIPVDKQIPREAKAVKLRLRLPAGDKSAEMPALPETTMQKVRRVSDREVIVTIRRINWAALDQSRQAASRPADPSIAPFLQASQMLDINDKRIKRLARQAVAKCKNDMEKADALRKKVTDYVSGKGLDVGFATASEVVRSRRGDCSEHGVLLAALARAAGLPARGVSGIVLVPQGPMSPGKGAAFGYHMWTQVYVSGQWVDIDAALRQTDCDPTHVALAIMPLNDEGFANSILSLLPMLGRLQIEVLSVE